MPRGNGNLPLALHKKLGFIIVFAAVWTVLIAAFDLMLIPGILLQRDAERRFVRAEGTVLSSRLDQQLHPQPRSHLFVDYEYHFAGQRHTSNRWSYYDASLEHEWACSLQKRWESGMPVQVYCDPANPNEATLLVGILPAQWMLILFLLVFHFPLMFLWPVALSMWLYPEHAKESPKHARADPFLLDLLRGLSLGGVVGVVVGLLVAIAIAASGQSSFDAAPTKVAIAFVGGVALLAVVAAFLGLLLRGSRDHKAQIR